MVATVNTKCVDLLIDMAWVLWYSGGMGRDCNHTAENYKGGTMGLFNAGEEFQNHVKGCLDIGKELESIKELIRQFEDGLITLDEMEAKIVSEILAHRAEREKE